MTHKLNTFCSYCGARQSNADTYPKRCGDCGLETYLNAAAVGVGIVPINGKLLVIRRAIKPFIGEWALPGGYKNVDETWEEGIAREIFEETGVPVDAGTITLFDVKTAVTGQVIVFGRVADLVVPEPLNFNLDRETMEAKLIDAPIPLCFPHHQTMMMEWFALKSKHAPKR